LSIFRCTYSERWWTWLDRFKTKWDLENLRSKVYSSQIARSYYYLANNVPLGLFVGIVSWESRSVIHATEVTEGNIHIRLADLVLGIEALILRTTSCIWRSFGKAAAMREDG